MRNVVISFLLVLTLFGCAVGPNYRRPSVETPPSWRFEEKEAKEVANAAWWEPFEDPVLNELIQIALKENKDLKIAAARVEEFMGRHVIMRASLFPQMGAGASAGRSRSTEKSPAPGGWVMEADRLPGKTMESKKSKHSFSEVLYANQ